MPKFSKRSKENLRTAHPTLQEICRRAIKIVDFAVIAGHRSKEVQDQLFEEGKSKLQFPDSKHNTFPSLAVDVVPYPVDWEDQRRFYYLAGVFQTIAHDLGVDIRHGGDWDEDDIFKDQKFYDLPHFELKV